MRKSSVFFFVDMASGGPHVIVRDEDGTVYLYDRMTNLSGDMPCYSVAIQVKIARVLERWTKHVLKGA